MRAVIVVLSFVVFSPAIAVAGPIVDHYYSTGQLEFGTSGANQRGWGPYGLSVGTRVFTDDFFIDNTTYEMTSGPFIRQDLVTDGTGEVVESKYFYGTGTLTIAFELESFATGDVTHGEFRAPVDMTVTIDETGGHSSSLFQLGPGVFDAELALLLGIRPYTVGGTVVDDFVDVTGDYTSPDRLAYDVAYFSIDVPEPGVTALSLCGIAAIWLRRRSRRR